MSATVTLTAQPSEDLDPFVEGFLQRAVNPHCCRLNFIKLNLLWHIKWERYTPATLRELARDTYCAVADTRQAIEELCAAGFVRRICQEGKATRYALTEDNDLRAMIDGFFTVYHRADQATQRIIARMAGETFSELTRRSA